MDSGRCTSTTTIRRSIAQATQFSDLPPFRPGFDHLPVSTRIHIIGDSLLTMNRHLDHFKIRIRDSPCHCNDCADLFSAEFAASRKIIDELLAMLAETSSETSGRSLKRRRC